MERKSEEKCTQFCPTEHKSTGINPKTFSKYRSPNGLAEAGIPREPSISERKKDIFHIRTGSIDLKCHRSYKYGDTVCRLCGDQMEDIDHVVFRCPSIPREGTMSSIYGEDCNELLEISRRCLFFDNRVQEIVANDV